MNIHLCLHGIGRCENEREPGEGRYWVSEHTFLSLMDEVASAPGVVRLSFDDGNRSDAEIAVPALRERDLRATFFPLAGRLADPASLSGADLREIRATGMSIGSHGWSHISWRGLGGTDAMREFVDARLALEAASGGRITEAALPLGRYDRDALQWLKGTGYRTVYTSDRYPSRPTSWLQARYSLTSQDTVDSVMHMVRRGPGVAEARNLVASGVKRIR
ncbi:peptidoglycan/xylan/chitin deacetylase (PgdA/CDA1 family) [Microbacterium trichothecenolyticum]|uniref:polysaccharide deacetylase family protein n=1 Tax=Microbacterium trichothecenolyticum TaxID=69370 RepID=UPI00285F7A2D|nr:polysaccharide deacetylase family protein [Microbacterium trichothecenolyticum]MDR7110855.1 peptidoglycan/xylan/chitin deacetylase (PgdA/CDA1 family) [Microbacterium trichothecenolyticum]